MQALRFAITKIQPPRRRVAGLERAALNAQIQLALQQHRVLLLQAPAGFGKTSSLAALVEDRGRGRGERAALAWVSMDTDDDAERLLACLVAALEPYDLPWRTAPEALMEWAGSGGAGLRRAADELVNALGGADVDGGVIVLDDLHRVESTSVFALLDALLQRLPANWTLALSSRTTPPLALARLRAAGELAEFTQDDLRFSANEADELLRAEALPQASARELHQRTAGWPAGLRLALAALRTRAGAAGGRELIDRHLFDYIAAEVLEDMPPALHDFLLRCALLPELTATRAAEVSGDKRAAEWLDEIERRGLFATPLAAQERTLVLHDLFRDALLQRLQARLPEEVPGLLCRAAAGEPDALRRVGYLLRAENWLAAEAALVEVAVDLFLQGAAGEVLRLAMQFPQAQRSARLARLAGAACGLRWQWADMANWYGQAVQAAQAAGQPQEAALAQARLAYALYPLDRNDEAEALIAELQTLPLQATARALMLMAANMQHFRRGRHELLPVLYGEVLDILEAGETLFLWWECAPPFNWSTIAGMPALITRYVAGAWPRLGERPLPMRGELHLLTAVGLLWKADMAAAEAAIVQAEDEFLWRGASGEAQVGATIFRTVQAAMQGRADAVSAGLQQLIARDDEAPPERRQLWRHQMAIYGLRLSDTLGDAAALAYWASQLKENPLHSDSAQNPRAIAARARHAAAQGRWADALRHFDQLAPQLPRIDVMGQRSDLTLRWAHALLRAGRPAEAAQTMAPVLDRLIHEGVRGQALLCGPTVLKTLADAPWDNRLSSHQRTELRAVAQLSAQLCGDLASSAATPAPRAGKAPSGNPGSIAVIELSLREREVLEHIAAGDSNKVIARVLDISPHTVKRHVANILDKLGLSSRGQASAWLRRSH